MLTWTQVFWSVCVCLFFFVLMQLFNHFKATTGYCSSSNSVFTCWVWLDLDTSRNLIIIMYLHLFDCCYLLTYSRFCTFMKQIYYKPWEWRKYVAQFALASNIRLTFCLKGQNWEAATRDYLAFLLEKWLTAGPNSCGLFSCRLTNQLID